MVLFVSRLVSMSDVRVIKIFSLKINSNESSLKQLEDKDDDYLTSELEDVLTYWYLIFLVEFPITTLSIT